MNLIIQANIEAIIGRSYAMPKVRRGVNIKQDSKSFRIIDYLFKHGKTAGEKIMRDLELNNSPQAYIHTHMTAGRIICEKVNTHKSLYFINSDLKKADFGLT